jgi:L-ascorbate metabolism protein UlaG (beta-lactamase superfamily)
MSRSLYALAALVLCAGMAAADDKKVTIRWHGQSFFEVISSAGTRVVIDPHLIEAYGRPMPSADLILMTHFHTDHVRVEAVANHTKAKKINALKEVREEGRVAQEWNVIDEKFKDIHIETVGTYHDARAGLERGKNGVFILTVDGLRIVHLGDLGHLLNREQLRKIGTPDVLMIPVGGVYTLNGVDAQKVVAQLKPKRYIIPMHYGTLVYSDLLNLDYFLPEDQQMGTVQKFPRTNELTIDPKADVPKEPIIAVLNWEKKGAKK